jgi:hypothetical protein
MMTDLLQERTSLLRITVESPDPGRIDERPMELLVRLLAEREGASEKTDIEDGCDEASWEDAAWQ